MRALQRLTTLTTLGPHRTCGLDCAQGTFVGGFADAPVYAAGSPAPWLTYRNPWATWLSLEWDNRRGIGPLMFPPSMGATAGVLVTPASAANVADVVGLRDASFAWPLTGAASACYRLDDNEVWVADAPDGAVVIGDLAEWEGEVYAVGWELTDEADPGGRGYVAYQSLWRRDGDGGWAQLARMGSWTSLCDPLALCPGRLWPTRQGLYCGFPQSWPSYEATTQGGGAASARLNDCYLWQGGVTHCGKALWMGEVQGQLVGIPPTTPSTAPSPTQMTPLGPQSGRASVGLPTNADWQGVPWVMWLDGDPLAVDAVTRMYHTTMPVVWHGSLWQAGYVYVPRGEGVAIQPDPSAMDLQVLLVQRSYSGGVVAVYTSQIADGPPATTRLYVATTPRTLFVLRDPQTILGDVIGGGRPLQTAASRMIYRQGNAVSEVEATTLRPLVVFAGGDDLWALGVATSDAPGHASYYGMPFLDADEKAAVLGWISSDAYPDFRALTYVVCTIPQDVRVLAVSAEYATDGTGDGPSVADVVVQYAVPPGTGWDHNATVAAWDYGLISGAVLFVSDGALVPILPSVGRLPLVARGGLVAYGLTVPATGAAVSIEYADDATGESAAVLEVSVEYAEDGTADTPSVTDITIEFSNGPAAMELHAPSVRAVEIEWAAEVPEPPGEAPILWLLCDGESPCYALRVHTADVGEWDGWPIRVTRGGVVPFAPGYGDLVALARGAAVIAAYTTRTDDPGLPREDIASLCRVLVRAGRDATLDPLMFVARGAFVFVVPSVDTAPAVVRGGILPYGSTIPAAWPVDAWGSYQAADVDQTIYLRRPGEIVRVGIIGPDGYQPPDVSAQLLRDIQTDPWYIYAPGGF